MSLPFLVSLSPLYNAANSLCRRRFSSINEDKLNTGKSFFKGSGGVIYCITLNIVKNTFSFTVHAANILKENPNSRENKKICTVLEWLFLMSQMQFLN